MRGPGHATAAVVLVALTALLVLGCGDDRPAAEGPRPAATGTAGGDAPALPPPDGPLPRRASALAAELQATHARLRSAIAAWVGHGDPCGRTPDDVELLALRAQRIYQRMARRQAVGRRALSGLTGPVRSEAEDVVAAMRAIATLNAPAAKVRRRFRTGPALPPCVLRDHYRAATRRFEVRWPLLAAVHFVESAFGRMRNESVAGAQGPMQFMPATWRAYGLGGDVHDPHDAILGAANYLAANGAPGDEARALYHYNPSPLYVRAVSRYARVMRRDPRAFYALHAWQVFVRTPDGMRRLTGPGRRQRPARPGGRVTCAGSAAGSCPRPTATAGAPP